MRSRVGLGALVAMTIAGGLVGCQIEADDPFDVRSTSSAISLENGLAVNGVSGNGLYLNGLSFNAAVPNGLYLNGLPLNGAPLNGLYVNGLYLNGIGTNGLPTNGLALNGLYVNGLPLGAPPATGVTLNGLYLNGATLNGLYLNGQATNGVGLNGLSLNGLYLNGLPFNGLYLNGLYLNGLYVNGAPLVAKGLNGLRVNGSTPATAIKIASASGQQINLTASEEASFESAIAHLAWCALPAGQSATIYRSSGAARAYPGHHGLAPTWATSGLVDNPTAVDAGEKLRWCVEHYRPRDSGNKIYPGLALNARQQADLHMVLKYAASCALRAGDSVSVQFPGGPVTFAGGLGLAPEWKSGALTATGQKAVSACLAARTNALGNSVRISLRGPHPSLVSSSVERKQFRTHEGAFWGNVFGASPSLHACAMDGGGPSGRLCADGNCGFQMNPSTCKAACDSRDGDGNWTRCGTGDETMVLNTYLMTEASLSAGYNHTCARRVNGSVWCWGQNSFGQLGDGTTAPDYRTSAKQVIGLPGLQTAGAAARQLSAGAYHACVRLRDGRVWCWGLSGLATMTSSSVPAQASSLGASVANISADTLQTCAVKMDGTLWCWGANDYGQLGDGTTTDRSTPVQVAALGNQVVDVDTGSGYTCATKMDGTAWCWGWNERGRLGDGTTTNRSTPIQVTTLGSDVVDAKAGQYHACAIKRDGTLWCWGDNTGGQLGNGTTTQSTRPIQVTAMGNQVLDFTVGFYFTCAIKMDGTLWCWGWNSMGMVGDGTGIQRNTPVKVTLPRAAKTVTAGGYSSFALLTDGSVWGWGSNWQGQLGDGSTTDRLSPVRMTVLRAPGDGVCDFSESSVYEPQDCAVPAPEASCTDNTDNDLDGARDCSDSDCALDVDFRCGELCGTECDAGCPAALDCSGRSCGQVNGCGLVCGTSCDAGCNSCGNGVKDCGETGVDCGGACGACPVTLFSDDFSTGDVATLAPRWTESPTGTAGKWDITGTTGGSGYPYATSGAKTGHAAACTSTSGCSLAMATGVNMAGRSTATLSFLRFVHSNLDAGEYLKVEVWNGSSWTQVRNWTDGAGDDSTWRAESISLSPYLTATGLKVRFTTKQDAVDEHVHIDDVKIVAQ
jgi:alpha-tubulin suppressor-like RCC1 family protein